MPQQNEPPRPHGDPLEREIVENNQTQRQNDAPGDAEQSKTTDSTFDDAEGARRRKQYEGGAELVSKID
jgi:hypothetical protein